MFSKDLIQAICDWQRGGTSKQKAKRGERLKREAVSLPEEFRQCPLCCFRQISLEKGALWKLADQLELPESISAWTLSLDVAQSFKGGVPPQGWQGVIFAIHPPAGSVVVNLDRLFRNEDFLTAVEANKEQISGYQDGIGRYKNSQREVLLEVSTIRISDIHELGGYSSNRDELVRMIYGPAPSSANYEDFDRRVALSGAKLGPDWIEGEAKDRVIDKIRAVMPGLRTIKKLQAAMTNSHP